MQQKKFPCDKCGACCRHLRLFGPVYAWLVDDGSGMCRYFDPESNLCSIYPIRPAICNLEIGHALYFSTLTWDDFVDRNLEACAKLKKLP